MERTRILIADDHLLVAEAFKRLLEPKYQIVGVATNGRNLLSAAKISTPDIVLLDLGMPLFNGLDAGQELKAILPKVKIIVVTMSEDSEVASRVLRSWASGYMLKKCASIELMQAITEVLNGRSYVTPSIAQKVMAQFIRDPNHRHSKQLTQRQRQILQLIAEGHCMKQAADILDITTRTVAFHKYRIMEEFSLKNNSELVRLALREHLISEA